jgi:hypothetical protein
MPEGVLSEEVFRFGLFEVDLRSVNCERTDERSLCKDNRSRYL